MRGEKLQQLKGSHLLLHKNGDEGEAGLQDRVPCKKDCFKKAPEIPSATKE